MKKTAKILGLILVLALFALMAMGSGSSTSDSGEKASSVSADSAETKSAEVSIEEAVLYEEGGIRITAKSFQPKGSFGPELKLLIENDGDRSVTVQSRNTSVNGYMVETMFSVDVAPGKKANDSLTLLRSDLEAAGIGTVADIEFSFHIFDAESWDTLYDSEPIVVKTSAAEGFSYSFDDSGERVYQSGDLEIVVKGLSEDDSWMGPSVVVYLSNTGSRGLTVQARDVSVNGFMVEPVFSCDVMPGKHAIDTVTLMSSDLEENGIETIESIELSFHVFDLDTWEDLLDTEPVTITFN